MLQLDINNIFLNGNLEEKYIWKFHQDNGIPKYLSHYCIWVSSIQIGLFSFHEGSEKNTTSLLIYVDDIIVVGPSLHEIEIVKTFLSTTFKLKDFGILKYFLRLEITHSNQGIVLSQCSYAF